MVKSNRQCQLFPDAFKLEAVAAVRGGRSVSAVAAELGLPDRLLRACLRYAPARPAGRAMARVGSLIIRGSASRGRSKLKALLRRGAARTIDTLWNAIGRILDRVTPKECQNMFAAAGYDQDGCD